ncbi:STAS domain-containing protein [Streptacidiphilus sp. P02-A3a]|uniref:STAS domain-containing protein n=1 Tax=Streptacidiphilus sp. P02-A3a TaxID=2704468 RepID=UPI0015F9224D|nr:STAS domain-containing protein [Streptacidiphilus sp. P02-A3a]QMU70677.1 STAS domain-containing protein [Streptacidiphilus sp. P02-A3a]
MQNTRPNATLGPEGPWSPQTGTTGTVLNVSRRDHRSGTWLAPAGEIDMDSVPRLREAVHQCLRQGVRTLVLDLAAVTFCDASGLNVLLELSRHTRAAGGRLRLEHPSPMLTRMLVLTDTHQLLVPSAPCPRAEGGAHRWFRVLCSTGVPDDQ